MLVSTAVARVQTRRIAKAVIVLCSGSCYLQRRRTVHVGMDTMMLRILSNARHVLILAKLVHKPVLSVLRALQLGILLLMLVRAMMGYLMIWLVLIQCARHASIYV